MSLESVKSEVLPDCCADHVVWVQVFPLVNIVHWEERRFLAKTVVPKYFSHLAQKNVQIFPVPVRMSGQAFMVLGPLIAANNGL